MTTLTLTKHHGLGNDFLVLLDAPAVDLAPLARRLCDRRRGIGADGLLVASPADGAAIRMTLFNADGSRAEMSGNGIRCFAQAVAAERGQLDDLLVHTDAGDRSISMNTTERADTIVATVDMGAVAPIAEPEGWPALGCHPDRPVLHLSLGNPHSVVGVVQSDSNGCGGSGTINPRKRPHGIKPGARRRSSVQGRFQRWHGRWLFLCQRAHGAVANGEAVVVQKRQ